MRRDYELLSLSYCFSVRQPTNASTFDGLTLGPVSLLHTRPTRTLRAERQTSSLKPYFNIARTVNEKSNELREGAAGSFGPWDPPTVGSRRAERSNSFETHSLSRVTSAFRCGIAMKTA